MHAHRFALGAVAVCSALVVAACSSSGQSSTAANGTSSSIGGSTTASSAIPIGIIGSYSGTQAASLGVVPNVAQAWASTVNAAGGLDGHPIKLYIKDDAGNPATAVTAAHELVQQDKVVAIVGDGSNVDAAWGPYVQQAGVPVVGGYSLNPTMFTNPDFFPQGPNGIAANYGVVALAKTVGPKYGVLYCAEAAQCKQGSTLVAALAKALGVTLAINAPVSSTATDYTAICQQVKASGVQSYSIFEAGGVALRIAQQCNQQGVTARLISAPGAITASWGGIAAVNGTIGTEMTAPWFDSSTPATAAYQAAMEKYVPDIGSQQGGEASAQWVAGQLFDAAVKASGTTTVTPASVKKGLYALKAETLGGLTQPLTYTAGKPTVLNCYFTMGIKNQQFVTVNGLATSCAPATVIDAILKAM